MKFNAFARLIAVVVTALSLLFAGLLVIPVAAGLPSDDPSDGPSSDQAVPDSDTNRALDFLARKLAVAVSSVDIRTTVHDAVEKRFDGDTNALWSSLAQDSAFNAHVAAAASRSRASKKETTEQIASSARAHPRLQIAVPANFETWDPATYAPLVAYFPEGVDDTELKTITAYDSAGNPVRLDAQIAPKQPVIVLGLNERTDEDGNLVRPQTTSSSEAETSQYAMAALAPATYSVDVVVVELKDDKEPWTKGDAEIAMKARSRGCSGVEYADTNWPNLNDSGDAWGNGTLRNMGLTTCDVVFYWWEDDGGSFDFTLTYGGFSLGVHMDDSDDLIGGKQIPYASFEGSTMREDVWSALEMWTQ